MNGWKQTAFLIFQDSTFACFKSGFPIQIVELIHSNWIFCLRFYLRVGLNQSAKFNEFGWNFLHFFFSFSFSLFREVITFLEFFPLGEWVCNKYFLLSKKKKNNDVSKTIIKNVAEIESEREQNVQYLDIII